MNCIFADYKVEIINGSPHWGKKLSEYKSDFEEKHESWIKVLKR